MGCNCGKRKQVITAAAMEQQRQDAEYEARLAEVMAQGQTGEHQPKQ